MSDIIIEVKNLGKKYRLSHQAQRQGYTALRDVIANKMKGLFQRQKAEAGARQSVEDFWALKEVSFEIKRGEVVGIIGGNGAGKSTLLKILSRIIEPTTGEVRLLGRVASLLEVGTGFHPELTGRENIFLNGAILGMSRVEIKRKFDEIVAFAEVEKFLDTPVKRYSSGMYVRLAFAVAAHLEPEILIVDEVLAVGDAAFQKCLGKMQEVSKGGRTVLFVSHNMAVVQALCSKGILLSRGGVEFIGSGAEAIRVYMETGDRNRQMKRPMRQDGLPTITSLEVNSVESREDTKICLRFEVTSQVQIKGSFEVKIYDGLRTPIGIASVGLFDPMNMVNFSKGREDICCELKLHRMARGQYWLVVQLKMPLVEMCDSTDDGVVFEVHPELVGGRERPLEQGWACGSLEIPISFGRRKLP